MSKDAAFVLPTLTILYSSLMAIFTGLSFGCWCFVSVFSFFFIFVQRSFPLVLSAHFSRNHSSPTAIGFGVIAGLVVFSSSLRVPRIQSSRTQSWAAWWWGARCLGGLILVATVIPEHLWFILFLLLFTLWATWVFPVKSLSVSVYQRSFCPLQLTCPIKREGKSFAIPLFITAEKVSFIPICVY